MKKIYRSFFLFIIVLSLAKISFGQLPITISYNWKPSSFVSEQTSYLYSYSGFTTFSFNIPVIYYNPLLYSSLPQDALVFLRVHEHGHAIQKIMNEDECDCWAAKQLQSSGDGKILDGTIYWMENVLRDQGGDATHKNGFGMAQTLRRCRGLVSETPNAPKTQETSTLSLSLSIPKIIASSKNNFEDIKGSFNSSIEGCRLYNSKINILNTNLNTIYVCGFGTYFSSIIYRGKNESKAEDLYRSFQNNFETNFSSYDFIDGNGRFVVEEINGKKDGVEVSLSWSQYSDGLNLVSITVE
jgi:hypothetical protein